jgi:phosphate starvation-inducible PhoH-like protein
MDRHLRGIRERYGVRISARHEVLTLQGEDEGAVREVAARVKQVMALVRDRREPPPQEVEAILLGDALPEDGTAEPGARRSRPQGARIPGRTARVGPLPRPVPAGAVARAEPRPRTPGQTRYVEAIREHAAVFAVGPAGTGKTYLAVVEAVGALRAGHVRRIVLTRPAVEAGEKLGFLPGDFQAKINPYLRPLYDALGELLPWGEVQRHVDADAIEIVPLAYMRGRTLKDSFIILDEAQNTTPAQMKMFLTRMGDGSRMVVTGDPTQNDLPPNQRSGLLDAVQRLRGFEGIGVVEFETGDIVRHPLVMQIVRAYQAPTKTPREEEED